MNLVDYGHSFKQIVMVRRTPAFSDIRSLILSSGRKECISVQHYHHGQCIMAYIISIYWSENYCEITDRWSMLAFYEPKSFPGTFKIGDIVKL